MINILRIFILSLLLLAQNTLAEDMITSDFERGYNQYLRACIACHDMQMISRNELKNLKFQQTPLPARPLIEQNNLIKQQDLSLIYKQKGYNYEKLEDFFVNFANHPNVGYHNDISDKALLQYIHWANKPYQNTAKSLGILSLIYLSVMLIVWGFWAFKLHRRVIRRYDRYDVPNFPDDAPSNLTEASNDT
ncbi:MAG: hypothetical protein ACK5LE_06785 [Alphaproteobacteria bacterium]